MLQSAGEQLRNRGDRGQPAQTIPPPRWERDLRCSVRPRCRYFRHDVPPHSPSSPWQKSLRRTRHRVDPSRVPGRRDRVQRATPSARPALLSGVLPRSPNSPCARQGHTRGPRGRRGRRWPHRGATRSRRAAPSLRTTSRLIGAASLGGRRAPRRSSACRPVGGRSPQRVRRFPRPRTELDRAERQILIAASTRRGGAITCREVLAKNTRTATARHRISMCPCRLAQRRSQTHTARALIGPGLVFARSTTASPHEWPVRFQPQRAFI